MANPRQQVDSTLYLIEKSKPAKSYLKEIMGPDLWTASKWNWTANRQRLNWTLPTDIFWRRWEKETSPETPPGRGNTSLIDKFSYRAVTTPGVLKGVELVVAETSSGLVTDGSSLLGNPCLPMKSSRSLYPSPWDPFRSQPSSIGLRLVIYEL